MSSISMSRRQAIGLSASFASMVGLGAAEPADDKAEAASRAQAEVVGKKAKALADALRAGKVNRADFLNDPLRVVAQFGLDIPEERKEMLKVSLITTAKYAWKEGSSPTGCVACTIGLTIAFQALVLLTVGAVATAIVVFAPELAVPFVIAFLSSQVAFPIVLGILLASATALAAFTCVNLINC